jgi:glycosyltransferase involved in cell wall biosynthesis
VSRLLSVPLVGTNHTPISEFLQYSPLRARWFNPLLLKYNAWFYGRCAFVSSPSQSVLDDLALTGFHAAHCVVSNPVDVQTFTPATRAERNRFKRKYGFSDFTVLYAGRLAAEKRVDLLVRAVARARSSVPPITLAIVGKGRAEDGLRSLARSLGIADRVTFVGFVASDATLAEIYKASDIFCIMSPAESQSLAAMQGMACRLPVIGVRAWGLAEYLARAGGIVVEPNDIGAVAWQLEELFQKPDLRDSVAEQGNVFVQRFATSHIAREWEQIYGDVVRGYHGVDEGQARGHAVLQSGAPTGAEDAHHRTAAH